jgi:CelD/BcsL family acetyltransferase involved in cellulose biosynthesis
VGLKVERITDIAKLTALAPEWAKLPCEHPFQTPQWVLCWWKHLSAKSLRVRDELHAYAVREDDGTLVAVAPLMRTCRPGTGPLAVRVIQFIGADPNITELRRMTVAADREEQATRAILAELGKHRSDWDWLQWGAVKSQHASAAVIEGETGSEKGVHQSEFILRLEPSWEEQRAKLSRNIKESLRKCYNSLKRENIVWELKIAQTPEEVARAVPQFLQLHASRSKVQGTVYHRDVFDAPAAQAFLEEVCVELARIGHTRVFQIVIGGKVVATRIGFVHGSQLYLYFSGFDPEYGKYSVMTTTVCEAIQWAISQKLAAVDLSFGEDVSKTRWGPDEIHWQCAKIPSSSLRGRLARHAYESAMGLLGSGVLKRLVGRDVGV